MRVIYIDGSPLCRLGMKTLLGEGVITLSCPILILLKISPAPDLIIMDFPMKFIGSGWYLRFIHASRAEYEGVRILFFVDKTSPLILAFIGGGAAGCDFAQNGKRHRWCGRPARR